MTKQQLFDRVASHLIRQNVRSVTEDGTCMYRGPNGLRCAIGCLIPDEKYHEDFEESTVSSEDRIRKAAGVRRGDELFLAQDLQFIHDSSISGIEWPYRLRTVARKFNLSSVVVDHELAKRESK